MCATVVFPQPDTPIKTNTTGFAGFERAGVTDPTAPVPCSKSWSDPRLKDGPKWAQRAYTMLPFEVKSLEIGLGG